MKSESNKTSLDNFIKDTLKNPDSDLNPIDWSEIHVLLRHEQKSISIFENKKFLMISGIVLVSILLIVGVFQLVQYYSSLPDEPAKTIIPVQIPIKKTTDSSASVIKTAKIGSSFVNEEEDTSSGIAIKETDTIPAKKITTVVKPIQKQEKKKKEDTLPSAIEVPLEKIKMEELLPPVDTASKYPIQETKNEPLSDVDTSHKKFSLWPKKSRNKK